MQWYEVRAHSMAMHCVGPQNEDVKTSTYKAKLADNMQQKHTRMYCKYADNKRNVHDDMHRRQLRCGNTKRRRNVPVKRSITTTK